MNLNCSTFFVHYGATPVFIPLNWGSGPASVRKCYLLFTPGCIVGHCLLDVMPGCPLKCIFMCCWSRSRLGLPCSYANAWKLCMKLCPIISTEVIFMYFCKRPAFTLLSNLAAQYAMLLAPTVQWSVLKLLLYFCVIHKTCLGSTARKTPFAGVFLG